MDGLAIIDELRQRRIKLPVIILSAKRSIDERVEGLEAGGDDYLTKPFSFSELLARIQALIHRASDTPEPTRSSKTEFQIPEEILALSTDFKYELIARTASGNNTAVEACFTLVK